jgi:putative copper export protein
MLALARWLSETSASSAIRGVDGLIPVLQTIHILAIAMVMSSLLMIDLRVLQTTKSQTQSIADTMHRFESWIWTGLALLAASGATLIIAEPQRTLPNSSFQTKIVLIALAVATTYVLQISLRRNAEFFNVSGKATRASKLLAVSAFILWCAVATAGRFIAYTQPT